EGTHRILKMTIQAKIPDDGACSDLELSLQDGLRCTICIPIGIRNSMLLGCGYASDYRLTPIPPASFKVRLCPQPYRRCDANADGALGLSASIRTIEPLFFADAPPIPCSASADCNNDGMADLSDVVFLLNSLFLGGPAPSAPYPACGVAPVGP